MGETEPLLVAASDKPSTAVDPRTELSGSRRLLVLCVLAASAFTSSSCFACLVTFFPEEAARKGASPWQTGFVFSIFQLGCLISSPLCGQFMTKIGSKFLLVSGLGSLSVTTMLFGALAFSRSGPSFVHLGLVIRTLQGMSVGAHMTALLTTIANRFPDRVAETLGITESCSAVAFLVGPIVGGLLYQEGGFVLPFAVLGGLNLLLCPLAASCLQSQQEASSSSSVGSVFQLLRVPGVGLPLATILCVTVTMSFLDLTLAPQMDTFGVSTTIKGLLFTAISTTYVVANVLWGKLANKKGYCKPVMMCGSFINVVALLLIGPTPLVQINGSLLLLGAALAVLGIGVGAQVVPPFLDLLQSAKRNGYADDLRTDALVSGLTYTFFPLGAFVGPSLGGFVSDAIGFPWSTTGLAIINFSLGTAFLIRRAGRGRFCHVT